MKFLLDECCSPQLVKKVRVAGHDVLYVLEYDRGISDSEVLERSYQDGRILVTRDKDFGELVFRLKKRVAGIILLRVSNKNRHLQWPRLKKLISLKQENLIGTFVVIDEYKFRIRSLG
jgi:predicted nuclease of predicted toxin-antitoxin system